MISTGAKEPGKTSAGIVTVRSELRITFEPLPFSAKWPAWVAETAAVEIKVQREKASATNASASCPRRTALRSPWSV